MFYDHYEELCKKANKKPYTVAREIGLGTSNVAQWKKGSTPRPEILQRLSEYFGVSQAVLLGLDQKEKHSTEGEVLSEVQLEAINFIKALNEDELRRFIKMGEAAFSNNE